MQNQIDHTAGSGKRPLVITCVVLLLIVLGYLCFVAVPNSWQLPTRGMPQYIQPANAPSEEAEGLTNDPVQRKLYADDLAMSNAVRRAVSHSDKQPFIWNGVVNGRHRTVLALTSPDPDKAYELPEVAARFPQAVTVLAPTVYEIRIPMIAVDTHLVVSAPAVTQLLLRSAPDGFVPLIIRGGTAAFSGTADSKLKISSTNPVTSGPDEVRTDGRAYLQSNGANMTFDHTEVSKLGYYVGTTSGVSWINYREIHGTGGATNSVFTQNYFGAYSSGAQGLQFDHDQFLHNDVYGFDPHTGTDNTLITNTVADGNGRHGIIFSKGCNDNVIRDSSATGNGGAGFMIDDGNPSLGATSPSNRNLIDHVTSSDNRIAVVIEGGTGNTISNLTADNNRYGVWLRQKPVDTSIRGLNLTATGTQGIRIDAGAIGSDISSATIDGAPIGILINDSTNTSVESSRIVASTNGLRLIGTQAGNRYRDVELVGAGWTPVAGLRGTPASIPAGVNVEGWNPPPGTSGMAIFTDRILHPVGLFVWLCILLPPVLLFLPARRRRRRHQQQILARQAQ